MRTKWQSGITTRQRRDTAPKGKPPDRRREACCGENQPVPKPQDLLPMLPCSVFDFDRRSKSGVLKWGFFILSDKNKPKKKNDHWPLRVFFMAVILSALLSFFSSTALNGAGYVVAGLVLAAFIALGIVFDMIGVAVTAAVRSTSPWEATERRSRSPSRSRTTPGSSPTRAWASISGAA